MPRTKTHKKPKYHPVLRLPPLPPDQHEGLYENIAVNGVLVPILVDSDGLRRGIIDGNYRKAFADELGYDCPEIVMSDLDEQEKRTLARALNLARRQLTTDQKRQLIADQIRESPSWSLRRVGKMLGVDHKTVGSVRDEMNSTGEIPQLERTVGLDGKERPATGPTHERYTPSWIVDAARKLMGGIDLDPASSPTANKTVKATAIFTKNTDGLKRQWRGRIFLNPPFDSWPTWLAKLDREMAARRVREAVVVGPANISAFRPMLVRGGLLLLPNERPKYYDPNADKLIDPPFGSLVCYFGRHGDRFVKAFCGHGIVLQAVEKP